MIKPTRAIFGIAVFVFTLAALPVPQTVALKSSVYSFLEQPIRASKNTGQAVVDFFLFRKNAEENRQLRKQLSDIRFAQIQNEELRRENERLTKLLEIRRVVPTRARKSVFARVIGRSPSAWSRVLLIDKGTRQGIRPNMLVLSESSLVGKVVEAGKSVSKVLLITDPNCKIGVLIQRTRQQGVLYGTSQGQSRVKYLSLETPLQEKDLVETAGLGGFYPKGIPVGEVRRAWKEPGQVYQVAEIRPMTDLSRVEEVVCVE